VSNPTTQTYAIALPAYSRVGLDAWLAKLGHTVTEEVADDYALDGVRAQDDARVRAIFISLCLGFWNVHRQSRFDPVITSSDGWTVSLLARRLSEASDGCIAYGGSGITPNGLFCGVRWEFETSKDGCEEDQLPWSDHRYCSICIMGELPELNMSTEEIVAHSIASAHQYPSSVDALDALEFQAREAGILGSPSLLASDIVDPSAVELALLWLESRGATSIEAQLADFFGFASSMPIPPGDIDVTAELIKDLRILESGLHADDIECTPGSLAYFTVEYVLGLMYPYGHSDAPLLCMDLATSVEAALHSRNTRRVKQVMLSVMGRDQSSQHDRPTPVVPVAPPPHRRVRDV
jgi:hypothetical protein